jgi:hypothetical protein
MRGLACVRPTVRICRARRSRNTDATRRPVLVESHVLSCSLICSVTSSVCALAITAKEQGRHPRHEPSFRPRSQG